MTTKSVLPRTNYTDKGRISFSEVSDWVFCQYKHYLKFVKGWSIPDENANLLFGNSVHLALEMYFLEKEVNPDAKIKVEIFEDALRSGWEKCEFDKATDKRKAENIDDWLPQGRDLLLKVPEFINKRFEKTGYTFVSAEETLYVDLKYMNMNFKGKIDLVIKEPLKDGQEHPIYWILDWKTATVEWNKYKRDDFMKRSQLFLYRKYWAETHNVPIENIKTAFVVLAREKANLPEGIEFIEVNTDNLKKSDIVLIMKNAIASASMGIALKTGKMGFAYGKPRDNCAWCVYNNTQYCEGNLVRNSLVGMMYQKQQVAGVPTNEIKLMKDEYPINE